jgi:serine/threonine-protein kinase
MPVCPGCYAPLGQPRCDACGAAASPGGLKVESVLSQTLHGRVYAARDEQGRLVALKELVFALAPNAQTIDLFERESKVLAGLQHPAIPRFVSSFREGQGVHLRLYLAQELAVGEPLSERLQRGRLTDDEVRGVARQALQVLSYLHGRRVLHRDLKPANLILGAGGALSLVDFGVARELLREVTHHGTVVGTFGYMPVEQLGGTVDARSDLYALGATLLHCLTGIAPGELLKSDLTLDTTRAGALKPWLDKLVALRREDRFADAHAALSALDNPGRALRPRLLDRLRAFFLRRRPPPTPAWPELVHLPPPSGRIQL